MLNLSEMCNYNRNFLRLTRYRKNFSVCSNFYSNPMYDSMRSLGHHSTSRTSLEPPLTPPSPPRRKQAHAFRRPCYWALIFVRQTPACRVCFCGDPTGKSSTDQAHSCPRDWRFSAVTGVRSPETLRIITALNRTQRYEKDH